MVDFSKLKSQRGSQLAKLTDKLAQMNTKQGGQKDERIFRPGFDKKEGKGYAVIRFLPAKAGDPFVKKISHSFQGSGGWYIETSRVTEDPANEDPVAISNRLYWDKGEAEGNETYKNVSRKRKRQTKYYANVYVIKDSVNPENNGKVMIYEFGPQIFKMIETAIKPEFEDDEPVDPFDMWSGADFRIKIVGKEIPDGKNPNQKVVVPNYEDSEFAKVSEFFEGDDEKKEEIFNLTHDLSEFTKVKSFKDLADRFQKVTGEAYNALEEGEPTDKVVDELKKKAKLDEEQEPAPEPKSSPSKQEPADEESSGSSDDSGDQDDDDVMNLFRELSK